MTKKILLVDDSETILLLESKILKRSHWTLIMARNGKEAIAKALSIGPDAGGSIVQRLKRELANDELLLILDNLEQVIACGPLLVELLESAPGVRIVATSQAALRVRGEHEYAVPPLTVPADLATDELVELLPEFGEERASALIMAARAKAYA